MKTRFKVVVHPSLLRRDKWSVYLVPSDQPDIELIDSCGLDTREEAVKIAEHMSEKYPAGCIFDEGVTVNDSAPSPKGEYEKITADEETLTSYLADHFEDMFKKISKILEPRMKFEPKKWIASLLTRPIALAVVGIVVYYFPFDIPTPDWFENIMPSGLNTSSQLILAIPLLKDLRGQALDLGILSIR